MPTIIKFNNDTINYVNEKNIDLTTLYKKCSFKKPDNFNKLFVYEYTDKNNDEYLLEFFGRNKGDNKCINSYSLSKFNYNDKIYGKFLCLIKYKNDYINFDENFFTNINNHINDKEIEESTISVDVSSSSNKNLKENNNNHYKINESDSECDSEYDSEVSEEGIYDSELQYEDYDYSDE